MRKIVLAATALAAPVALAHPAFAAPGDPVKIGGGLSLDQLLSELDSAKDPSRPVRIITIGMGEADPSALQQISAATGGTSYIANTPQDIERILVEALLARRVAPA